MAQEGEDFFALLKEINDHWKDGMVVPIDDTFIETKTGQKYHWQMTRGWELNIVWKDSSSDWISLKDLKQLHPIQVTKYALANKIALEPAFAWWIQDVLCK